jgi:hypothetical protein
MDNHIIFESIGKVRNEAKRLIANNPSADAEKTKMFDRLFNVLNMVETTLKESDFSFTSSTRTHDFRMKLGELEKRISDFGNIDSAYERRTTIDEFINIFLDNLPFFSPKQEVVNKLVSFENEARESFNKFNNTLTDLESESQKTFNRLKDLEFEGKKLLHIYTGAVLGNDFDIRAKREARNAKIWTTFTIISAVATLGVLVFIFNYQFNKASENIPINYQFLTTKLFLVATLGVIAKWTSKRANRHLLEESKYHRLALNLKTADAFIKNLEKSKQDEVIASIAGKIFTETTGNETPTEFESAGSIDVLKQLLPTKDK